VELPTGGHGGHGRSRGSREVTGVTGGHGGLLLKAARLPDQMVRPPRLLISIATSFLQCTHFKFGLSLHFESLLCCSRLSVPSPGFGRKRSPPSRCSRHFRLLQGAGRPIGLTFLPPPNCISTRVGTVPHRHAYAAWFPLFLTAEHLGPFYAPPSMPVTPFTTEPQ
jgi:hypothetical protein